MTKSLVVSAIILLASVSNADVVQKIPKTLICTNSAVSGLQPELRIETVIYEDSAALTNEQEVEAVKVSRRNDSTAEFKTVATKKSITTDGSYATADLNIRAVGRITGSKDECFKRGTEFVITQTGSIGGRGNPVILVTIREMPRFIYNKDIIQKCLIPRPMMPRPYNASCTIARD